MDGFIVDLVRGNLLVEIQSRNFSVIKRKLKTLAACHYVRLIYPIAQEKWIVKVSEDAGHYLGRRKSPKRGSVIQVFEELVSFPELLSNSNFSIDVIFIQEEELRRHERGRAWRRNGWVTHERRLIRVLDRRLFETPADFGALIPSDLSDAFTTLELAEALATAKSMAQKMAYCLRKMGAIESVGKSGNAVSYVRSNLSRE